MSRSALTTGPSEGTLGPYTFPAAMPSSLEQLEASIRRAPAEQQRQLLARLPHLLDLTASDVGLLKAAEGAFAFWDNPDDAAYDRL